ncbi:MAG: energy transducer TonB [Candidatus Marinimicrobia bacterium]|nr:energy transducer TonB [Candidatus Neomarinimicrobiota bacterium]
MIKTRLTLTALLLIVTTASLMANPVSTNYTAEPEPVHGLQDLVNRTIFPAFEQDLGRDGYVVLNFHVDVVGNISNIEVAKSAGPLFDQSAIEAVMSTDWNPAMQNGTATPVNYQLPFEFHAK